MKLIYWNTKNSEHINVIAEIFSQEQPDILFLSETKENFILLNIQRITDLGYQLIQNPGCERVVIIGKINLNIELGLQHKFYTNVKLNDIEIISVHFPSSMFHHMDALRNNIQNFRTKINNEIGDSTSTSIIVIGDLNVNPFEEPMINFDGFMATNSLSARKSITNIGETKETYYNPTWQLYSDNRFPGTKKFARPSGYSFDIIEFHLLDQVLLSQKITTDLIDEKISTLKKTENYNLYNNQYNRVEISDHLPLVYEFN